MFGLQIKLSAQEVLLEGFQVLLVARHSISMVAHLVYLGNTFPTEVDDCFLLQVPGPVLPLFI